MARKIDRDMPFGRMRQVEDFLPAPGDLAQPRSEVKVTLALSRRSIAFFKEQARRNHTKYQRMIRALVDKYAAHYQAR